MVDYGTWIIGTELSVGIINLLLAIILFYRLKYRSKYIIEKAISKGILALILYFLFSAMVHLLWAIQDTILVGNLQLPVAAVMLECIIVYIGVLFSVFIVGTRPKLIISIASVITGAAVLSLLLFGLEYEVIRGTYVFYPPSITKWILIPVTVMALIPVGVWLIYAMGMKLRERKRGITLAIGFLLVALARNILVHYFKVPLLPTLVIYLAGTLSIYFGFTTH
jgi:vacuolar-type H+-ATPase subunit I/STV1